METLPVHRTYNNWISERSRGAPHLIGALLVLKGRAHTPWCPVRETFSQETKRPGSSDRRYLVFEGPRRTTSIFDVDIFQGTGAPAHQPKRNSFWLRDKALGSMRRLMSTFSNAQERPALHLGVGIFEGQAPTLHQPKYQRVLVKRRSVQFHGMFVWQFLHT